MCWYLDQFWKWWWCQRWEEVSGDGVGEVPRSGQSAEAPGESGGALWLRQSQVLGGLERWQQEAPRKAGDEWEGCGEAVGLVPETQQ